MSERNVIEIVNEELASGKVPCVPAEKMATLIDPTQLDNLVGFFKKYAAFANDAKLTEVRRQQNERKAKYWRDVANKISQQGTMAGR